MRDLNRDRLSANGFLSKKQIIINNFIGGLTWGVGTAIGAGVVVAIIGTVLKKLGIFDSISAFLNNLSNSK